MTFDDDDLHDTRTTLTLLMVIHGNRNDPLSRKWALDVLKDDGAWNTDEAQAAIARRVLRLARRFE
jgi:hypothetical protein